MMTRKNSVEPNNSHIWSRRCLLLFRSCHHSMPFPKATAWLHMLLSHEIRSKKLAHPHHQSFPNLNRKLQKRKKNSLFFPSDDGSEKTRPFRRRLAANIRAMGATRYALLWDANEQARRIFTWIEIKMCPREISISIMLSEGGLRLQEHQLSSEIKVDATSRVQSMNLGIRAVSRTV